MCCVGNSLTECLDNQMELFINACNRKGDCCLKISAPFVVVGSVGIIGLGIIETVGSALIVTGPTMLTNRCIRSCCSKKEKTNGDEENLLPQKKTVEEKLRNWTRSSYFGLGSSVSNFCFYLSCGTVRIGPAGW